MKENNELTRDNIAIDHDMEVDCDEGREIAVYIETWFDVDRKFHIDTASDDDTFRSTAGSKRSRASAACCQRQRLLQPVRSVI